MRTIDPVERRARLARRHALHPDHRAAEVVEATRRVVALHATDPATIVLSAAARVDGLVPTDVERALHVDRTLVKHMAMRRTLWVVAREDLGAVQVAASDRVAGAERRRLVKEVEAAGLHLDGGTWLAGVARAVLDALAGGREASSTELRREIPALQGTTTQGAGRTWGGEVPVGPRVLTVMGAEGRLVRATNDGRWTASRPRWTSMDGWLGAPLERPPTEDGTARVVEAWLRAFGPGTETDIVWWLGGTRTAVRAALAALDTTAVDLGGTTGHVMADDAGPVAPVAPWAALLPSLDPTTMGWSERGWYLGAHGGDVFDRNGNAGATAWWDGRIVGGWRQDPDGVVVLQLLEDPGAEGRAALDREAARLTAWLDGLAVPPRFPSPLSKRGM